MRMVKLDTLRWNALQFIMNQWERLSLPRSVVSREFRLVNRSTRFDVTSQFGQVWSEKPNPTRPGIIGKGYFWISCPGVIPSVQLKSFSALTYYVSPFVSIKRSDCLHHSCDNQWQRIFLPCDFINPELWGLQYSTSFCHYCLLFAIKTHSFGTAEIRNFP